MALIDQQEAIKKIRSNREYVADTEWIKGLNAGIEYSVEEVENLPPVQPKRGKWLPDNRCGGGYWVCSSCKYPTEAFAANVIYKYCPFCGADMRGETE